MSNRDFNKDIEMDHQPDRDSRVESLDVFDDPVAYLARLGITAHIVDQTALPAAA